MAARKPNGASSIYQGADGYWHGRVTVGVTDDGRSDRRHVMSKSQAVVTKKVRELERQRGDGSVRQSGSSWTVAAWLAHWLENIAAPFVRENTIAGYRVAVNVHLIPGLGRHRLERLQPEHLEMLYVRMMRAGKSPATAHQAHRTLRTALNEAVRRGHLSRNPAVLAKAPRLVEHEMEPFTVEEVQLLLKTALTVRNGARWAVALALGLRQGEALGLQWSDVDLDSGSLMVRRARLRPRWGHGCGGTCGRKTGGQCPSRVAERSETSETKSRAGRRAVGLPGQLVHLLREHRVAQERERVLAAQLWVDGHWVFATPTGAPINPRTDYTEWKRLLLAARRTGCSAARCPAYRGHGSPHPGCPGAGGDGDHGLVTQRDGGSVSARDKRYSAGHRPTRRGAHLGRERFWWVLKISSLEPSLNFALSLPWYEWTIRHLSRI